VVELGKPEYGTLNWVTLCALKLTANKVLTNAERKKLYLQTLVLLITGNAAKHTDLAIVMGILSVVRTWLLHPVVVHVPGKPSEFISLTEKVRPKRFSDTCIAWASAVFSNTMAG